MAFSNNHYRVENLVDVTPNQNIRLQTNMASPDNFKQALNVTSSDFGRENE
jgi:hypothetical protein